MKDGRYFNLDEKLAQLFETKKRVHGFALQKFVKKHITPAK